MNAQELKNQLEQLIDSNSVAVVLESIAEVCNEKAEHIRANWQDRPLAKTWDVSANLIRTIADKVGC